MRPLIDRGHFGCKTIGLRPPLRFLQPTPPLPLLIMQRLVNLEALAFGTQEQLFRPCVDCGLFTGCFCDGLGQPCFAAIRVKHGVFHRATTCKTLKGQRRANQMLLSRSTPTMLASGKLRSLMQAARTRSAKLQCPMPLALATLLLIKQPVNHEGVFQFDFVTLKDGFRHLLTASSDFCCRPCFDEFGKSGSRHEAAQLVKSCWRSVAVWRRALSERVRSIGHSSFDFGSQWSPPGFFEGRALVIAGSEEREALLMRGASAFLGDLSVRVAGGGAELYVGGSAAAVVASITEFMSGPVQERHPVEGLLALAGNSARDPDPAVARLDDPSVYLVPGCDGGDFGHLATLAQSFKNCHACQLEFDEEAMRRTSLSAVASLFVRRVLQDQSRNGQPKTQATAPNGHDPEDSDPEPIEAGDLGRKVVLVGHVTGASLAFEMAMHLQEAQIEVALVVIQGEVAWSGGPVPDRSFSASWLGSTCEATLLVARCLGAADFASKEAKALWQMQEDDPYVLKGQLKAACQFAFEGHECQTELSGQIFRSGLEEASKKLVMKAYWKLSEKLNGLSVDGFKSLIHTTAKRIDWLMGVGAESGCSDGTFDGPSLLVLAKDCPSEEAEHLRCANGLYCNNLDVVQVPGDRHSVLSPETALSLAAEIQAFARHWMRGLRCQD
ncbi:Rad54b [Symbiodinium natans]|uniref:Rad54b protein n=1 Tax=Symbiodinium natans TaxID=878477 RepID=A0A812PPT9_9DINO|nr:Rad54b [Symbiodinium natans]